MVINTDTHNWTVYSLINCGALNPKQDILAISLPQSSEIYVEEEVERWEHPEEVKDFKELAFSKHSRTDAHMNSLKL